MTTIKEVAESAGVSFKTVSRVINNHPNVTPQTKERVWQAIHKLNYKPNISARNLRRQSSNLIGYGWQQAEDGAPHPVLNQFLYSAVQRAELNDFHLLAFLIESDVEATTALYRDLFARRQVEGFILADTNDNDPRIQFLIEQNIPFATFGRSNDDWDFCWVDVDGQSGLRQVTAHLQEQGHKRIAIITWPEGSRAGEERESGYFQQMARTGLPISEEWIQRGNNTVRVGYQLLQQLLSLPDASRPTAVACVSDQLAIGAMNSASAAGLVIGQDIAITGFDNLPMTEFLYPPLTTVDQPIQQAGEQVVDLLLKQINEEFVLQKGILLEPSLIIRESSQGNL